MITESLIAAGILGFSYLALRRGRGNGNVARTPARPRRDDQASTPRVYTGFPSRDLPEISGSRPGVMLQASRACPSSYFYASSWWPADQAPRLPLPDCKPGCGCKLINVHDRRQSDRRVGRDRRDVIRFDTRPSRRSGVDRRSSVNAPFSGKH